MAPETRAHGILSKEGDCYNLGRKLMQANAVHLAVGIHAACTSCYTAMLHAGVILFELWRAGAAALPAGREDVEEAGVSVLQAGCGHIW